MGNKQLDAYIDVIQNLPSDIKAAEVNLEKNESLLLSCVNGKESGGQSSSLSELYIRVESNDGVGSIYTQKFDDEPTEVMNQAYEISRHIKKTESLQMNKAEKSFPADSSIEVYPYNTDMKRQSKEYKDENFADEEAMRVALHKFSEEILNACENLLYSEITLSRNIQYREVLNHTGFHAENETIFYTLSAEISAENNGSVHLQAEESAKAPNEIPIKELIARINEKIGMHLPVTSAGGDEMKAVLDEGFVCNLFHMAWKLFSAKFYLQGQSALCGRDTNGIFSKLLNIEDRICSPNEGFRYLLDCEGTQGRNVKLVENGTVKSLLHNLETAEKMHTDACGNAGRKTTLSGALLTDITVIPKNFTVIPGKLSAETMIKSIDKGIYLTQCFDEYHSLDEASGNFAIPAEGVLIENGRLSARVTDLSVEGNILDLLANVVGVGKDVCTAPLPDVRSFTVTAPALQVSKIKIVM